MFERGAFGRVTARTGPDGVRHEFGDDPELRLTDVTNTAGPTWDYEYDAAGRLLRETDATEHSDLERARIGAE